MPHTIPQTKVSPHAWKNAELIYSVVSDSCSLYILTSLEQQRGQTAGELASTGFKQDRILRQMRKLEGVKLIKRSRMGRNEVHFNINHERLDNLNSAAARLLGDK